MNQTLLKVYQDEINRLLRLQDVYKIDYKNKIAYLREKRDAILSKKDN